MERDAPTAEPSFPRGISTPIARSRVPPSSGGNTATKGSTKGKEKAAAPVIHKYDMAKAMEEMEDDDEFGSEDSDSMHRKEQQPQMHAADKKARKGQAQEPPAISYASTPELHGSWSGFVVDIVADYEHLYNAAMDGDRDAVRYYAYLNAVHQRASLS